MQGTPPKKVVWVRSSLKDLKAFPETVQRHLGFALKVAQFGEKHEDAKPLRGFRGASVVEIVEDYDGDAYRAVYTVKFEEAVYVLHAFQKKAKRGSETTQAPPRLDRRAPKVRNEGTSPKNSTPLEATNYETC